MQSMAIVEVSCKAWRWAYPWPEEVFYDGHPRSGDWQSFLLCVEAAARGGLNDMLQQAKQLEEWAIRRLLRAKRRKFQEWLTDQVENHHSKGIFRLGQGASQAAAAFQDGHLASWGDHAAPGTGSPPQAGVAAVLEQRCAHHC